MNAGVGGLHGSECVFNIVWTGETFTYLKYFVLSLMRHSSAQFRFIANHCSPASIADMEAFATRSQDRVVEVIDVSPDRMVAHGQALDAVLRIRNDGELFCLVDPDIRAAGPFVDWFTQQLAACDAITSGREMWNDDNVVPEDSPGVGGRHFFDRSGFCFGSPHLGFYRRAPLDETMARWDVGFGSAGPELSPAAKAALAEQGHRYRVYDTGKILNAMLQVDGCELRHLEHPDLMHIGGLSHFLAPGRYLDEEKTLPEWTRYSNMQVRFAVAQYTAGLLRALVDGDEPPDEPTGLGAEVDARIPAITAAVTEMVASAVVD